MSKAWIAAVALILVLGGCSRSDRSSNTGGGSTDTGSTSSTGSTDDTARDRIGTDTTGTSNPSQDIGSDTANREPDNTGVNTRDRNEGSVTADDQPESATDRDLAARVRQAIYHDKSLSMTAHNVKIITKNGVVTLRGPVKSTQEKDTIETKTQQIAGVTRVDNQLEVVTR